MQARGYYLCIAYYKPYINKDLAELRYKFTKDILAKYPIKEY